MRNASERKDIRRYEKFAKVREQERINYIVAAMSTKAGRTWFYNFLSDCHCFQEPWTGDALQEAKLKGERTIGLSVYNDIVRHCPNYFLEMMTEANIEEQLNGQRDTRDDDNDDDRDSAGERSGESD